MILASLVLDIIRVRMDPGPAREIVRWAGVGMLAAAVVQLTIFRAKPKAFEDKSASPGQE